MINLRLFRDISIITISLFIIGFSINYGYNKIKNINCISEQKLEQIRAEKQKEIDKKQKEIDSVIIDLKLNKQKIDFLLSKVKDINTENSNLEKELEKRKSDIIKMSNDEIINYWKNEFKK